MKRNWKTQRSTTPRSQWCSQILPSNITSPIRMARRKTWPEGVAEKRGRKAAWLKGVVIRRACRNRGRRIRCPVLWRSEALVLKHSHANSEKARVCINAVTCNTFLNGFPWASSLSQRHADDVGVGCNVQGEYYNLLNRSCQNSCRTLALFPHL